MTTKAELRSAFSDRRNAMTTRAVAAAENAIRGRLLGLPELAGARTVFSYIAFGNEVDTRPTLLRLLEYGCEVIAPPTDQLQDPSHAVHFLQRQDPLLTGPVPRPLKVPDTCDALDVSDVDVFIVPGIVWDRRGYRIGFGGGYFDRLLARARPGAVPIGLAYDFQVTDRVPEDEWDQPVKILVAESGVVRCANR